MNSYLLFKSLHLIAVISWMAGLLYLPRIFVYHSENNNEIISSVFKTMERKLFYYIMTPAMAISWLFGLLLNHFNLDQNKKTSKFYRYINEIPTLMLILIVFIVVFKPIYG